jgi:hypothetical protein
VLETFAVGTANHFASKKFGPAGKQTMNALEGAAAAASGDTLGVIDSALSVGGTFLLRRNGMAVESYLAKGKHIEGANFSRDESGLQVVPAVSQRRSW